MLLDLSETGIFPSILWYQNYNNIRNLVNFAARAKKKKVVEKTTKICGEKKHCSELFGSRAAAFNLSHEHSFHM
jgi:hypothetical protein